MAIVVAIVCGASLALHYARSGLFEAFLTLVSIFLSALTALAFGPTLVHTIGVASPYALAATLAGLGLLTFTVIRGALVFLDSDVDFHPLIERAGGGLVGLSGGLLIVGFACVCLLTMPLPSQLDRSRASAVQAAEVMLAPCRTAARLMPGARGLELETLIAAAGEAYSTYVPPPPAEPAPANDEPNTEPSDDHDEDWGLRTGD